MMSLNDHMKQLRSFFFSHAEPNRFGVVGRVERKSFLSELSSFSKVLLLSIGFAFVGGVIVWAQPAPLDATTSFTYNSQGRITLYTSRAGTHRFTLAPEDKSKTGRNHWPIIFIDYENNGKNIREMINLTEEREFEVNVSAANGQISICGEDGIWKLVAIGQDLRTFPSYTGTELRYLNLNDNIISNGGITLYSSVFPKLETIYVERNRISGTINVYKNTEQTTFDYLRRLSFMENRLSNVILGSLNKATYINVSKNLLTAVTPPTTMHPGGVKVFKGGNADTYNNRPEELYETIGENDVKFDLTVNRLNIATLPKMPASLDPLKPMRQENYLYTLQARYALPRTSYALMTDVLDLSSQLNALGVTDANQKTKYRFFIEENAATDQYSEIPENYYEEVDPGKFRFLRGVGQQARVFAAMTTDAFPNPLESYELGAIDTNYPQWGYTGVLKQPEGTPSADRETYKNDLPNNTIGDGTTRELSKRFYRTNTFTLNSMNKNYWYGFESNVWGNPKNWTGGFVPPTTLAEFINNGLSDVQFATKVNYTSSAIRDLHTDGNRRARVIINRSETGKSVVVNPGHLLVLESMLLAPSTTGPHAGSNDMSYRTIVRAEQGKPNGAFFPYGNARLSPDANGQSYTHLGNIPVTLEMFSKAFDGNRDKQNATWQYFGLPFHNGIKSAEQIPAKAWVRKYNRLKNDDADEKWEELSENEILTPGTAYEITQPTPALYRFTGGLFNSHKYWPISTVPSPSNYNDMNILANPFAVPFPIDASKMGWPSTAERTIYLYNTGSRKNWDNNNGGTINSDTQPGAYTIGIPIDVANQLPGMPKQIPTLSAFLIKSRIGATSTANLGFVYNLANFLQTPVEENRTQPILPSIWMTVESDETSDQMWLVETDKATEGHDDGYDGEKIFTSGHVQLYALESKNYQVSSKPEIKHTDLAFVPGDNAGQYVLNVKLSGNMTQRQYYLVDRLTGETLPVIDSLRYSFSAKSSDALQRFTITTEPTALQQVKAQDYDIHVDAQRIVTVRNHTSEAADVKIFDAAGKNVANFSVAADTEGRETLFAPGVYVIHITNAQAQVTQRYVVH